MKGIFIAFEGGDGSGKTTQQKRLVEYLKGLNKEVVSVREPGGTVLGEKIRELLLLKHEEKMEPWTEVYLYAACRAELVQKVIRPALDGGKIVLADRYFLSSLAYQGVGRNLKVQNVFDINQWAIDSVMPNLTIFLDVPPLTATLRRAQTEQDRIEDESAEFHRRVYEAYKQFERDLNLPMFRVDGKLDEESIFEEIRKRVDKLLEGA